MVISLAIRGLQLVFAAVTLSLSAYLISSYGPGKGPSILSYGSFCGGAGLIIGLIGAVATFIDKLQGIIILCLDAFATFFLAAGGIAFAVNMKVRDCSKLSYYAGKAFGVFGPSEGKLYGTYGSDKFAAKKTTDTINRCRIAQADTAFIWFMFAAFIVTIVLAFFGKSGKRGGSIV